MRLKPLAAATLSRGLVGGITLVCAGASILGQALPARADLASVTAVYNPSPDVVQKIVADNATDNPPASSNNGEPATPPTATFQVTVDSPLTASGDVMFVVTSGPNGSAVSSGGPGAKTGPCVISGPAIDGYTPDSGHPVCSYPQSTSSLSNSGGRGGPNAAGVDTVDIFANKDGKGVPGNNPKVTVKATWVDAVASVSLSGPTSMSSLTCTAFTTAAADAGSRPEPHKKLTLRIVQGSNPAHPDPTALRFCGTLPNHISLVSPTELRATINTGTRGEAATFFLQTDGLNPLTVQSFEDRNGNGVADPHVVNILGIETTAAEVVATKSVTMTVGGPDGVKKVVISVPDTSVFKGETVTGTITLTDLNNSPIGSVTPVVKVTGANPQTLNASPSDGNGKSTFSYIPSAAGSDTITAFVDQTGGLQGVRDPNEPQGSIVLSVGTPPVNVALALTSKGTLAGGAAAPTGVPDVGDARHGIVPDTQTTNVFTAHVTDSAATTHPPRQGISVRFMIPSSNGRVSGGPPGSTGVNNATLSAATAVTDVNGDASVTLTNPKPVSGDGFTVVASIGGTQATSTAWLLHEASTVAPVPDPTNNALGTTFPTAHGTIIVTPSVITTQVGTNQTFTAAVTDQFGAAKAGVSTIYSVTQGRNAGATPQTKTSDSNGKSSATLTDSSTAPLANGQHDVVQVTADKDNDLSTTGDQISVIADRFYTSGPPLAAGISGGVGTPTDQFATTPPYAAKTSDDTGSAAIDETHAVADMVPTKVFFQVRNSDNSSRLYGRTISVENSGVGAFVEGTDNHIVNSPAVITIGSDGFARVNVLSLRTGTQLLTATIDNVSSTVSINWTNIGAQRVVGLSPTTTTIGQGTDTTVTVTAIDAYGSKVAQAPVTLTLTGPGAFADGSSSVSAATGADGTLPVRVRGVGVGTVTVAVTMSGSEVSKGANDPIAGALAGKSTDSSSITVTTTVPADSAHTTLTLTPSGTVPVNSQVTATGIVRTASGQPIAGKAVKFVVSGVTSGTKTLTTDSNGAVSIPITSANNGTVNVSMSPLDKDGVAEFAKTDSVNFGSSTLYPKPRLAQQSSNGTVLLTFVVDKRYVGKTVYFFRKSGITGKVVPLGTGQVNSGGYAFREFNTKPGGILALYGKVLGAEDIEDPYSNTVAFKVQ